MPVKRYIPVEEKEKFMFLIQAALIRSEWNVGLFVPKLKDVQCPVWEVGNEDIENFLDILEARGLIIYDKEAQCIFNCGNNKRFFEQQKLNFNELF